MFEALSLSIYLSIYPIYLSIYFSFRLPIQNLSPNVRPPKNKKDDAGSSGLFYTIFILYCGVRLQQ